MTVYDYHKHHLNIYDLVEVLKVPKDELLTEEMESDADYREEWNNKIRGLVGGYAMIYYFHPDDPDPKWYYESSDNISIMVRHIYQYKGNTEGFPKESLMNMELAIPPGYVRRLSPNPILMFPYAAFMLQTSITIPDSVQPDEPYLDLTNDVAPPLETFEICKKILNSPLAELEKLGDKMFQDFLASPSQKMKG